VKLLTLALALLFAAPALAEMEVYHPRHRAGEDLRPLAEAALGPEGSVAVDGNTGALVLIGTAAAVGQALELLTLQDRPLRTVLIRHETRTLRGLEAAGYRVAWSAGGESLRVGNVEATRVGNVEAARSGAAVVLDAHRGSGDGVQASSLRVLEGEWGRIAQGDEVVLPSGSHRYPDAVRVAADSGLEVRPRILGDGRVRLDLRSFQAQLRTQPSPVRSAASVAHEGAITTLVVTPGVPAVVGGIGRSGASSTGSLGGGARSGSGRRDSVLVVTVTLDDGAPAGE